MIGDGFGMTLMMVSNTIGMLVHLMLWVGVAVVGALKGSERARMVFVAAGVAGVLIGIITPILHYSVSVAMTSSFDVDVYGTAQAAIGAVTTLLRLLPWGLLLVGIWRTGQTLDA